MADVKACSMAPHLMWALWGIAECETEIAFGYLEFAQSRLAEFDRLRAVFELELERGPAAGTSPAPM